MQLKLPVSIAASILAADLTRLGEQVAEEVEAAGVDYVHVDVMDGRFVPNLSFGPLVVEAVRRVTTLPLNTHLMIIEPERSIPRFVAVGSD
jgi:ribulose-phosphate 3-epimerase